MWLFDRLVNLVSGLGTAKDKALFNAYALVIMDKAQLDAAYRGDWIARKIVDVPAFDETREWRDWQADKSGIEKIEAEEARLGVQRKVAQARKLARLYGGSVIFIGDGSSEPMTPLSPKGVKAGGLKYLNVFNRYEIDAGELDRDPLSETFGEPTKYTLGGRTGGAVEIHPSRVVRFSGADIADRTIAFDGWGDSVLQAVNDAVQQAGGAAATIASLLQEAKVDIIKIPEFSQLVATEEFRKRAIERFSLTNTTKSMVNAVLLDAKEDWSQKQISFAQLPEVLNTYLQIASGAADIPATRLLGQTPGGLQSTGQSDIRNYYDRISAGQNLELRPALSRLDEVLIRSALGDRPDEVHYTWAPLWQMTEVEKADVALKKAQAVKAISDTGLIPDPAFARGVQNMFVEDGTFPGLDTALDEFGDEPEDKDEEAAALNAEQQRQQANDSALEGIAAGDLVEFESDRQTEKGPSSGRVLSVESGKMVVAHSDHPGEEFDLASLKLRKKTTAHGGETLWIFDAKPRTLYVSRKLLNADEFLTWAKAQGFETTLEAGDLHVTVAFSREPVDWMKVGENWTSGPDGKLTVVPGGARLVEPLGDKGAIVLLFNSSELAWRHMAIREAGASWDWPEYQPHVTITYQGTGVDLEKVEPYRGKLVFGPEIFAELDEDWTSKVRES